MTAGREGALRRPEALLLLFALAFAPLAFGAVEPWSRALVECAALFALALALRRRARGAALRLHQTPGALPLLLLLGLIALQAVPLPPAVVRVLSPAAHVRWSAALGDAPLPWLPLSLDPLATLRELSRFAACAAVYLVAVQLLARGARLRAATTALSAMTALLAFAAILQAVVSPQMLLFVRESPSRYSFGPFVNRNHFANLMAMLVPVVLALQLGRPAGDAPTSRGLLAGLLARPGSAPRLLHGAVALLAGAALALSFSRGGIIAAGAGLLALASCLAARRPTRGRATAAALFLLALALLLGPPAWRQLGERFVSLRANPDVVDTVRAGLWRDTLRIAAEFPLVGAGAGSFARVYPAYRSVPGPLGVDHAHNDYLELAAGAGLAGLGLFAWFLASVLLAVGRACRQRRDPAALTLACGAVAGCVAFLVHGASDFSLAIDANAFTFFFLLALAVSAAHTRGAGAETETLLEQMRLPAAVARLALAAALAVTAFHAADLAAGWCRRLAARAPASQETRAETQAPDGGRYLRVGTVLQPFEPDFPAALARLASREGRDDEALRLTRRALRLRPVDGANLEQLAALHAARGEDDAAGRAFTAAVASDRISARYPEAFGAWLLSRGERARGVALLREAVERDPARTPQAIALLVLAGFKDRELAAALPRRAVVLRRLARYFELTGSTALATQTTKDAMALETREAGGTASKAGASR